MSPLKQSEHSSGYHSDKKGKRRDTDSDIYLPPVKFPPFLFGSREPVDPSSSGLPTSSSLLSRSIMQDASQSKQDSIPQSNATPIRSAFGISTAHDHSSEDNGWSPNNSNPKLIPEADHDEMPSHQSIINDDMNPEVIVSASLTSTRRNHDLPHAKAISSSEGRSVNQSKELLRQSALAKSKLLAKRNRLGQLVSATPTSSNASRTGRSIDDEDFDESTYFTNFGRHNMNAKDDASYFQGSSSDGTGNSTESPSPSAEPAKKNPSHRSFKNIVLSRPRAYDKGSGSNSRTPLQTLSVNIPEPPCAHHGRSRSTHADEPSGVENHQDIARLVTETVRREIAAQSARVQATGASAPSDWDEIIYIARKYGKTRRYASAPLIFTTKGKFRKKDCDPRFIAYVRTRNVFNEAKMKSLF